MSQNWIDATLETLDNGEAINQVNHQLRAVFKNIMDLNTDPKAKRTVTLKIHIKPNHDRTQAGVEHQTTVSLAPDAVGVDQLSFNQAGNAFVQKGEQLPLGIEATDFDPESGEVIPQIREKGGVK